MTSKCPDAVIFLITGIFDFTDHDFVAVIRADRDHDFVTHMVVKKSLPQRRFNTDQIFHGITTDAGDDLIGLAFIILFDIDGNGLIEADFIGCGDDLQ